MKIFADTGDLNELKELDEMGLICGITTNPTLASRLGMDLIATLKTISSTFPEYPLFAQVVAREADQMVEQARIINTAGANMVVKIPATNEGLKAIAKLEKEGITTCGTTVLTSAAGLLCALAGATYISPYTGQDNVVGFSGLTTLKELVTMLNSSGINTKIIAASVEKPQDVVDVAIAGADIATLTYQTITNVCEMSKPLTSFYIDRFAKNWDGANCFIR